MSERKLEFAWTRDGRILVGYNPRTEEGGWVNLGDVTEAVTRLEKERDEALALLNITRQRATAFNSAIQELLNGGPDAE